MDEVTALALAARDGDRVALSAFIRRTWADVARLVAGVAGADLAEDAAQETYVRALRALPAYRGEAGARTWLLSIARRTAVDAVRRASRRRRQTRLLAGRAGAAGSDRVELADGVLTEQVLAGLDADRRTAFVLTQLLGFDYAGAAQICRCPVGTIRSRVARAREQLIAEMALGEGEPGNPAPPAEPAGPAYPAGTPDQPGTAVVDGAGVTAEPPVHP